MFKYFLCSAILAVVSCRPGIVFSSYHGLQGLQGAGSEKQEVESWSGGGGGGGIEGHSGEGDFHHGVSLVGSGEGKGQILDLTGHGDHHDGHFGGSFVASSKYSAGEHSGEGGHGHEGGGGGFEAHYSDVLGASDDHSGAESGYEVHQLGGHYGHY